MKKTILICFVLSTFFSGIAQKTLDLNERLTLDPKVRTGKFPNGMTYYIQKNAKPEKRVQLMLAVKIGSLQENDDQQGLAHFVEHMAFNGTKNFPNNKLDEYLQSVGIKNL